MFLEDENTCPYCDEVLQEDGTCPNQCEKDDPDDPESSDFWDDLEDLVPGKDYIVPETENEID